MDAAYSAKRGFTYSGKTFATLLWTTEDPLCDKLKHLAMLQGRAMWLLGTSRLPAAGQRIHMRKRQGNNPKRRILPRNQTSLRMLQRIIGGACYAGSAHHKRRPSDYGFHPPANPRPDKSLCDNSRTVLRSEAIALFHEGVARGMVSSHFLGDLPKYVWAVDSGGRVYEAKIGGADNREYHGYELEENEAHMRRLVLKEWQARCPTV